MTENTALRLGIYSILALAAVAAMTTTQSNAQDAAASALVATQLRDQGYPCTDPATATRDPEVDDDAVWILTCKDASYRVRLVPDQAAQVEKLN